MIASRAEHGPSDTITNKLTTKQDEFTDEFGVDDVYMHSKITWCICCPGG
jgi:hypothetical protein